MDELNSSASVNESSLIDDTFLYLTEHSQCSEVQKRVIRNKARKFFVRDGVMYFKKIVKGKIFMRMGIPRVLTTDNGTEFKNQLDTHLAEALGIKRIFTTPYHPQANGLDERFNQTLQNMIVKFVQDKKEIWDEYLDICVYAYNTSVHESTNFSPFEVMFGRKAILPIDINIDEKEPDMMLMNQEEPAIAEVVDVMSEQRLKVLESVKQSIQQAQIKQKHAYDKKHASKHSFEVGEMVIKKDFRRGKRAGGKLDTPFVGPYIIIKCHGKGMYCLQLASNAAEIVERVSGAYLKPYQKPKEDGQSLHLEQREYALSKDIDVALWIDYRLYYGEAPLREVYGGDFVIVTEDLNDEFDVFKRKVFSYLDDALRMVRSIDLLNIWIRESNVSVKSLQDPNRTTKNSASLLHPT
eukprot:Em0017g865a